MHLDDTLGLPADKGQLADVLARTGLLLGESFDGFFASLLVNCLDMKEGNDGFY